jgi:8-oxo-dGTP pyrophosphatase MutT (NUDIX family)
LLSFCELKKHSIQFLLISPESAAGASLTSSLREGPTTTRTTARELREEIGLECSSTDLVALSEQFRPAHHFNYICTSHYDEGTYFYLVSKELPLSESQKYEGKDCGADEQITLHVWRLSDEPATLAAQLMVRDLIRTSIVFA